MLDPRIAAGAVAVTSLGWCAAQVSPLPQLGVAALALSSATLLHTVLTFPCASTLVRFAPSALVVPYVVFGMAALVGARAVRAFPESLRSMTALGLLLLAITGATLLASLWRVARREDTALSRAARIALAGAALSVVLSASWLWLDAPTPILWASGASLPLSLLIASGRPLRRRLPFERATDDNASGDKPMPVSLNRVAQGIAHAMVKPIQAVSQVLHEAAPRAADATLRANLEDAADLMAQLQRLVRDILDLARAQAEPRLRRIDVAKLIEHVIAEVRGRFRDSRIEIEVGEGSLFVDEVAVRRMLVNLVENALEAGASEAWVSVRAVHRERWVQLLIEDRGGGLPPEVRERLFEPFVSTKPRGTGLGLTVVREVCRAHGGTVEAHSTPQGTTIVVMLPTQREER